MGYADQDNPESTHTSGEGGPIVYITPGNSNEIIVRTAMDEREYHEREVRALRGSLALFQRAFYFMFAMFIALFFFLVYLTARFGGAK